MSRMFGIDLAHIIEAGGILLVAAIVFAESGLLVGFFLPGDSLLFTAGLLSAQGHMSIVPLVACVTLAAIIGDSVGYNIGKHAGKRLFKREDSLLFHKDHIQRAEKFYEAHGGKAIILARFVPVVRTFAPVVAGVGTMEYRKFLGFNVIGALLWATGITILGYVLGTKIPNIDHYLLPVIGLIILVSVAPALYHLLKEESSRQALKAQAVKTIQHVKAKYGAKN